MKKMYLIIIAILAIVAVSCTNKKQEEKRAGTDTTALETENHSLSTLLPSLDGDSSVSVNIKSYHPSEVKGNWKADGKEITLKEEYFSRKLQKNIIPAYIYNDVLDYDSVVSITIDLRPALYLTSVDNSIDTLFVSDISQLFGFYLLKNEGDLDGDGGDELGIIVNFADYSSTNYYDILSYKNGKWVTLYSFPIWEWQLDDGTKLLSKAGNNKIKITFRNDDAVAEEKIVDLSKLRGEALKRFSIK